jgi:hypothetical protein
MSWADRFPVSPRACSLAAKGTGLGGVASAFTGLAGGFAEGGLIRGDGMQPSDSNVALVSDGEYIVNACLTLGQVQATDFCSFSMSCFS